MTSPRHWQKGPQSARCGGSCKNTVGADTDADLYGRHQARIGLATAFEEAYNIAMNSVSEQAARPIHAPAAGSGKP